MGSYHLIERGALMFPAWLREDSLAVSNGIERRPNLTSQADRYLAALQVSVEELSYHVLAMPNMPKQWPTRPPRVVASPPCSTRALP